MKEKIGNLNFDFKETYNNEVTPERIKNLEDELQNINTIEAKLDFLKSEKVKYLIQITNEVLEVSGRVDLPNLKNKPLFFDRIIQTYIDDLENRNEKNNSTKTTPSLESIFISTNNSYQLCLELLEDLQLTIDGVPNIKKGRMGKLTGLITALKDTPFILKGYKHTNDFLLQVFNTHLKSNFKKLSKRNEDFEESYDDAKKYLKKYLSNKK
jgi:hypothetical protein